MTPYQSRKHLFLLSWQQALVGLAFGPEGSNALIEHTDIDLYPWRNGEALYLAVVLGTADDAVQIVRPPLPLSPAISWWGSGVGGGDFGAMRDEEWLRGVRESMELMSAVLNRELPATFVEKDLLPKVY